MKKFLEPSNKKNSFWLAFQFVVTLISSMVSLKLNILNYGKEIFGIWLALASIWGFGSTFDFGFGLAIVKYVAEKKNDLNKINSLLSSILIIFIGLGLVIVIICFLIAELIYFNGSSIIPTFLKNKFFFTFILLSISFYLQYLSFFFKSILEGLNNFVITSRIIITQNIALLVGVAILYIFKYDIIYLAVIYILSYFLTLTLFIYFVMSRISFIKISYKKFNMTEAKEILKFSFSIQLMNGFYTLINPLIIYMISNFYSTKDVPAYEIARRFSLAISGLFFNVFKFILPKSSVQRDRSESINYIKKDILKYSNFGVVYSCFAFGVMILPVVLVMHLFFGIRESILLFVLLSLPEVINNFGYAIYNFLLGVGRASLLAFIQFLNVALTFILLFVGLKYFHNLFGLLGYFIAVTIGNILMLKVINNDYKISYKEMFAISNVLKLLLLLPLLIVSGLIYYSSSNSFIIIFGSISLISMLLFFRDFHLIIKEIVLIKYLNFFK